MKPSDAAEQFVTDTEGRRIGVLLDINTYQRLRDAEEELADIRAYDEARPAVAAELKAERFCTLAEYRARAVVRAEHEIHSHSAKAGAETTRSPWS